MTALDASARFRHYLQPHVGYRPPTHYAEAVRSLLDTIQCAKDFCAMLLQPVVKVDRPLRGLYVVNGHVVFAFARRKDSAWPNVG